MSGHSKWSKVKHFKGAVDAKRSKLFTKLVKEITVAAKMGLPDPDANPRLRLAIQNARAASMPKDTVERAIKKASGAGESVNYEEVLYEGYGPGKFAVIVETLTDNRNRTAASVRTVFNKNHATLGAANSVQYMFQRKGTLLLPKSAADEARLTDLVLEAGADDLEDLGDEWQVTTAFEQFMPVKAFLEAQGLPISTAELAWLPTQKVLLQDQESAQKAIAFVEALEDEDDVQNVFTNFDVPEAVLSQLA
ncbi:MAG TPA: YebC/PmpR family DNA-binding transcriptional regulator [bacterium]|nr:YebC/PmpR family DNA-binding transcriptional regulator [bacterium]